MSATKLNPAEVWRQIEEHLTPACSLWASEQVVVLYLARRRCLNGQPQQLVLLRTMARSTGLSRSTLRTNLRRLASRGILRILGTSYKGIRIELKLPHEITGVIQPRLWDGRSIETIDFWTSKRYRGAIHRRCCFYCLRRLPPGKAVLDHAIPRARCGRNSYRNLVSCCEECNMSKRDRSAATLLRQLFRQGKLDSAELRDRQSALQDLAEGNLKPELYPNTVRFSECA